MGQINSFPGSCYPKLKLNKYFHKKYLAQMIPVATSIQIMQLSKMLLNIMRVYLPKVCTNYRYIDVSSFTESLF